MAKENYHDKGYKELLSKRRNFVKFLRHFVKSEWVKHVEESDLHLCDKEPLFDNSNNGSNSSKSFIRGKCFKVA